MSRFKLSRVKRNVKKINLNESTLNYSLKPFIVKWIKDHPPKLSYSFKSKAIPFEKWKKQVHELIARKIRVLKPLPLNEQDIKFYGESNANGIRFLKFSLMVLPGIRVPSILCIPQNLTEKAPAIICIHGHGQSKENSVGIKRSKSKEYFGYELAKLGLITLSFDWIGSGEREKFRNKFPLFFQNEGERSNWLRFLGLNMLGLRITEVKGLIDYLETMEEVDSERIGIIGHSGGGTISLFSTVLDNRIKVCCTSGYFGTWEDSILAMYHCGCNYSNNLGKYIELYDVYASIAPLPVAATIGKKDRIFPYKGTEKAIPIIKKAYREVKKEENLLIDIQSKGHRFYGDNLYPFILNKI
ncbi:MAG: alpha/beta hydrolase family protein [Promethearchaeota archaeon]